MTLPELFIPENVNLSLEYSGMDSPNGALDKKHFDSYKKPVWYNYNSRGFRDNEWPSNLSDVIWCIGDSFTVGLGQPFEETWVQQLNNYYKAVNISMDGASNEWMVRKAKYIIDNVRPKNIIIQWSHCHRRERPNQSLSDMARRRHYVHTDGLYDDLKNHFNCMREIEQYKNNSNIIHSWIPDHCIDDEDNNFISKIFNRYYIELECQVLDNTRLDLARDGYHYDVLTAKRYVKHYLELLK
jgi:hypothetical protein